MTNIFLEKHPDSNSKVDLTECARKVGDVFADVDETEGPSIVKKVMKYSIVDALLTPEIYARIPKWISLAFDEYKKTKSIKGAEGKIWADCNEILFGSAEQDFQLRVLVNRTGFAEFYPGVPEHYRLMPQARKIHITRANETIAHAYDGEMFVRHGVSFQHPICTPNYDEQNKGKLLEQEVFQKPNAPEGLVFVRGDSIEDAAMLDVARFYVERAGGTVLGFYVAPELTDKVFKDSAGFDYIVSQDHSKLVEKMKGNE